MKQTNLSAMTAQELARRFVEIAVRQVEALLAFDPPKIINKYFWQLAAITDELKSREGDQRHVLLALYEHPNPQVRLKQVARIERERNPGIDRFAAVPRISRSLPSGRAQRRPEGPIRVTLVAQGPGQRSFGATMAG